LAVTRFVEVMKPHAHEKCIVARIIGSNIISRDGFLSNNENEPRRLKSRYIVGSVKNNGEMNPPINPTKVPSNVMGGARYRALMVPL